MAQILVHLTHGPEHPTRAALAFLVAKSAIEEGHQVTMFLAGDAVQLMRKSVIDNLTGLGIGKLRDSFDAVVGGGGQIYLSKMSSGARGFTEAELSEIPAHWAAPSILVQLSLEHDRMFTY